MSNQKRTPVHEVFYGEAAESGGKGNAKKKRVGEAKAKSGGTEGRNPVDPPAGSLPAPQGDETPLWQLEPNQLRARLDAQLWPTDGSAHKWVPQPPMTLDQYIRDGI